jgi:hypothetical protein
VADFREDGNETEGFIKFWDIAELAERLLICQKGLGSMGLVSDMTRIA